MLAKENIGMFFFEALLDFARRDLQIEPSARALRSKFGAKP